MINNQSFAELVEKAKFSTRMNQGQLAVALGISPQYMSDLVKGRKQKSEEKYAKKLAELCGEEEPQTIDTKVAVPFFDDEIFTGGYLQGTGDNFSAYAHADVVRLPFLKVKDGDFAVQVHGRSMIDTEHPELSINDGAIVCLRPWRESFIEYGERYAIATRSGFTVKYIAESDREGYVKCVPANKEENFTPYYINENDITGIAKVTAIINLQIMV
jgi:transcriptional regulator with XRE-family HTH domain